MGHWARAVGLRARASPPLLLEKGEALLRGSNLARFMMELEASNITMPASRCGCASCNS
jgi:hypothetical protein